MTDDLLTFYFFMDNGIKRIGYGINFIDAVDSAGISLREAAKMQEHSRFADKFIYDIRKKTWVINPNRERVFNDE